MIADRLKMEISSVAIRKPSAEEAKVVMCNLLEDVLIVRTKVERAYEKQNVPSRQSSVQNFEENIAIPIAFFK